MEHSPDDGVRRIEALEDKVRQLEQIVERMSTKLAQLERRGREGSAF